MPFEAYNGLSLRAGKTDSTGTDTSLCDGAAPGSPVLYDGHTLYTPGLSENTGGASRYYSNDRLGNLWTIDGSSKGQLTYEDFSGFGGPVAGSSAGSPFGYGGGNGCQTDADTGLVLMGHRYYDARIGRFITQDPVGDGDNWYEYADNDPVDNTDPTGLVIAGGGWGGFVPDSSQAGIPYDPSQDNTSDYLDGDAGTYNEYINGVYQGTKTVGGLWDQMNTPMSGGSPGAGFAGRVYGPNHHYFPTRKTAMDAARNRGQGKPLEDVHSKDPKTPPHFHTTDKNGDKKSPSDHYYYPRRGGQGRPDYEARDVRANVMDQIEAAETDRMPMKFGGGGLPEGAGAAEGVGAAEGAGGAEGGATAVEVALEILAGLL